MKTSTLTRLLIAALFLSVFTNLDSTAAVIYGGYQATGQVLDCKKYKKLDLEPRVEAQFIIKDTIKRILFYKPLKIAYFMVMYAASGESEFFNELKDVIYEARTTVYRGNRVPRGKSGTVDKENG